MQDTLSPTSDDEDDLTIPDFCRISAEDRKAAWERFEQKRTTVATPVPLVDPVEQRQQVLRDNIKASRETARKEKNRRGFELMQAKHPNERYVRPKRKDGRVVVPGHWVPK